MSATPRLPDHAVSGVVERPLVKAHPAFAERILDALIRPGDEAVE
jgi:hypothetical protein